MVKLHSKTADKSIPVREMKDGQIGIITQWHQYKYSGRIIQRHDKNIITIGGTAGQSWNPIPKDDDCRVRILQKGELIEI